MDIAKAVSTAKPATISIAMKKLLESATHPAFGSPTKRELELMVLEALIELGCAPTDPSVYDLVSALRVTKSKARALIYDRELRRQTPATLDLLAKEALKKPLLQAQGYAVALDIENPYLADHLRARVRSLGHPTDGSFSPNLIRLSSDAAAALIDSFLSPRERKVVEAALRNATGEKGKAPGLMAKAISIAAGAVAGKAAGELAGWGADALGSLVEANKSEIEAFFGKLVKGAQADPPK